MMKNVMLQSCIALDILTASQGGSYAIIHTKYNFFIPDESYNVTYIMIYILKNMSLNDPLPSLGKILEKCFGLGSS